MISLSRRAYLLCGLAVVACSSDAGVVTDSLPGTLIKPAPTLTTFRTVPEMLAIQPGTTQQLSLMSLDQSGSPMDVSGNVTYTSDSPGIAQVNDQGIITGVDTGIAKISATVRLSGIVQTAQATAFVRDSVAFPDVVLTYGPEGWSPYDSPVPAGSIVQWRFDPATTGAAGGKILLKNSASVVIDSVFIRGAPALHQFAAPGMYQYCLGACTTAQSGKITVR